MSGHVGIYVGNGEVVEWRGFNYGCVVTRLAERPWKYWYAVPWVDYDIPAKNKGDIDIGTLGSRLLKRGRKGPDVAVLQELLKMLGYDIGEHEVDSYYGKDTERAVREFQKEHDLEVDGDYGQLSHREMMNVLEELERGDGDTQPVSKKKVRITGGRVNARSGAGTNSSIITVVREGDTFEYVATAENGWHGIRLNEGVAWVSNKYSVTEE